MEERVFGDEYCEGVYSGRLGSDDLSYRLEKFEDKWYISDGTGDLEAVLLVDKHTPIFITEFYPDKKISVHLYVIENLRQGAEEHAEERSNEIDALRDQLETNDTTMSAMNSSYDNLLSLKGDLSASNNNLYRKCRDDAMSYQKEIDDLAGKLTQAKGRYNNLAMRCHHIEHTLSDADESNIKLAGTVTDLRAELIDAEADNIDLDKRNMGLIGRCQVLEEELRKQNLLLDKLGDGCSLSLKVELKWAYEQYQKVQDYVLANRLQMDHEDDASHAEILIAEHGYLFTKIQTIRNAAGLKNVG